MFRSIHRRSSIMSPLQAGGVLALLAVASAPGLAQDQIWLRQFGTSGGDEAHGVATDTVGGVFVGGDTTDSLGGPSAGSYDAFLARYDGQGNEIWVRQFGTFDRDHVNSLSPDGAGGVFVAGQTAGDLGGPAAGAFDAFVARFDHTGNQLWIWQVGTEFNDRAWAVAPDGVGGVLIGGNTEGDLGGSNQGDWDAFVARLDGSGQLIWLRQFGTGLHDDARGVAPDGGGGVFVTGATTGRLTPGFRDAYFDPFVARYDEQGNQIWIQQFGEERKSDVADALTPDGVGGVYVGGSTSGDLGGTSAGGWDVFLARYNSAGVQTWIEQFGTNRDDSAAALAPDGIDGVFVAGTTSGGFGGTTARHYDAFVAHHTSAGNQTWIAQFGTSTRDLAHGLAPDDAGGVFVCGETQGHLGGPNAGIGDDAFVARYSGDTCYPDCDKSTGAGVLDIFDFLCFQSSFVNADPYACDCDTSTGQGVCDIFDFLCFQDAFVNGCP